MLEMKTSQSRSKGQKFSLTSHLNGFKIDANYELA